MKDVFVADRKVGRNEPVFIIAEVAGAHEGSIETAKKLASAALEAGADAIKFQMFKADSLVVRNHPKYDGFKKREWSKEQWKEVIDYCKHLGLLVLGEPFDEESVDIFDELGVSGFKIHSTDVTNPFMLEHTSKKLKPILLSIGGSYEKEIQEALNILEKNGSKDVILIHGYQNFPTKLEDTNLNLIPILEKLFQRLIGIHDHVDGESEMAVLVPVLAVGCGSVLVDKHITLDRSKKGIDYFSSLNPHEFKKMVSLIRDAEKARGSYALALSNDELNYRNKMKKFIVASKDLAKGDKITLDKLSFKRSLNGKLVPFDVNKIIGKKLKNKLDKDQSIGLEDVE